jgi:hypothetical protein
MLFAWFTNGLALSDDKAVTTHVHTSSMLSTLASLPPRGNLTHTVLKIFRPVAASALGNTHHADAGRLPHTPPHTTHQQRLSTRRTRMRYDTFRLGRLYSGAVVCILFRASVLPTVARQTERNSKLGTLVSSSRATRSRNGRGDCRPDLNLPVAADLGMFSYNRFLLFADAPTQLKNQLGNDFHRQRPAPAFSLL